jgi:hypothetical protein
MSDQNATPPAQSTPPVPPAPTFTYGQQAPAQPPQPAAPPPQPRYGEYAPAGYVPPAYQAAPPVQAGPTDRPRRGWDVALTIVFLALGLVGLGLGLLYAWILSTPGLLDEALRAQGYPGFDGEIGAAPAIITISHLVLYAVALVVSLVLLSRKIVAFWVPLAAGVLAAIIFWWALTGVLLSDPSLVQTGL